MNDQPYTPPPPPVSLPSLLRIPSKLLPIITDFNKYRYFLLEGGRGSAKTHSVARLLLFLADRHKLRIVCGRETQASIEESVYTVLRDIVDAHALHFRILANRLEHLRTGTTFRFKGFREQGSINVKGMEGTDIIWIDEAQALQKETLDMLVPTIIRKESARLFFTMNRYMRNDAVYEFLAGRDDCLHIHIDYFENPYVSLAMKNEAETLKAKSLREYKHIWLGEPLEAADDYLFNYDFLHAAFKIEPFGEFHLRQRVMGIDFAAEGNDLCVATILDRTSNQHWKLTEQIGWDSMDPMASVGKIVDLIGTHRPNIAILDVGGMGHVVWSRLKELKVNIQRFDGASTELVDTAHYVNTRANGYYTLKDWFERKILQIDPKNKQVVIELEKIRMKFRSDGRRLLQAKLDLKHKRDGLGYSPDHADSLMMAVWAAAKMIGNQQAYIYPTHGDTATALQRKSTHRRAGRK